MKTSKKVISLILSVIMIMTTFAVAAPLVAVAAEGDITIDGVSQTRIVTDTSVYDKYAADYLGGSSKPTDIVIPGLDPAQDYVIQGIAYHPQKDWMLVTAYYNAADGETAKPSKVFILDNKTGDFYAMLSFKNVDGSDNVDHGGGIAVSEHNLYYACGDKDREIAYAPLSAIEDIAQGEHRVVQLKGERDFYEIGSVTKDSKTGYTAYVCVDEGILWTGNFYDEGAKAIGITIAADGYNAPANEKYNSMVWGYELSGSTSEEEWANLIGATGTDCQGNPTYVVGISNNVKDIQYAVVDKGKLYMSCSYGSGAGNSVNFGFGDCSRLVVADIDLSVPGNQTVTFKTDGSGGTRTVDTAYGITWYQTFEFMPMSEGLCVIDDYVYMTFESACNKYLNESSGVADIGNCEKPVDVIWKMDQYALLGESRPHDNQSMYYEKVKSLADIKDNDEYMILYESPEKDPVTKNPILYALSCESGLNGYKLTKSYSSTGDGYIGAVGRPITEYDIEGDILYLINPEKDDVIGNRWVIEGANNPGNLRIKSSSTYFANYRQLYINKDIIGMTEKGNTDLNNMALQLVNSKTGNFYLHNNGAYLWCNDFSVDGYEEKANNWYSTQANMNNKLKFMYEGTTETKGTFHPNALDTTNIVGESVAPNTYLGELQIYKRVIDYYSDTVESRVYTDLSADLQADGTYTVTMETYATDPIQYQMTDNRPTDFMLVLDASGSMSTADCYTYTSHGQQTITYKNCKGEGAGNFIYYEGEYCNLERHQFKTGSISSRKYYTCVTFRTSDNREFHLTPDKGIVDTTQMGGSGEGYCDTYGVCVKESGYSISDNYNASHGNYELFTRTDKTRLDYLKEAAVDVIDTIAKSSADHRIALVTYGSDGNDTATNGVSNVWRNTGIYTTDSTGLVSYPDLNASTYAKAFFNKTDAEKVRNFVNGIVTSEGDPDTYVDYGFEMANQIIYNTERSYLTTAKSGRNCCIVMITDGVPGLGFSDKTNNIADASATTCANRAIEQSKIAKQNGAYVYACQLGDNSPKNFSMNNYLEYVSSNYPVANSLADSGSRNTDYIDYHIDVDIAQDSTVSVFSNQLKAGILDNQGNVAAVLTSTAVLKQQLSDAFFVSDDATVTTELIPGYFDAIDRLTFKDTTVDATGITTNVSKADKSIEVTGYDYQNHYIAAKHPGNKLRVTITGVLADENGKLTNTTINNVDTTAIFETADDPTPFKYFPREFFSIPEYTYVLDYGLDMLDVDVNGTLCAVSDMPSKQDVAAYTRKDPETQVSQNGLVTITNNSQDLLYTTSPMNFADRGFCLIKRDDGSYDWFSIKVVPASNVLYEEDYFQNKVGSSTEVSWTDEGTALNTRQTMASTLTDVYGYDSIYAVTENAHSNGTVSKTSVSSTAKRSATKTFEFIGSGFDLISACGPNTGIMIVKVSNKDGVVEKAYIVDTYYNGDLVNGSNLICQTPIVSFDGNNTTHTVEVTAVYLASAKALAKGITAKNTNGKLQSVSGAPVNNAQAVSMLADLGITGLENVDLEMVWFDDNSVLNGGTGSAGKLNRSSRAAGDSTAALDCYLDGFRIYNPLGEITGDYIDSEQNPTYINVINNLKNNAITSETTVIDGIAYVENALSEGSLGFANYEQNGPQNELYLNGNTNSIVLKVSIPNPDAKIQLGLRAVTGIATVRVGDKEFNISGPTEMYYDITDCVAKEGGVATITVQNTGSGVLALNNIKLTGGSSALAIDVDDLPVVYRLASAPAEKAVVVDGVVKSAVENTDNGSDSGSGSDSSVDSSFSNLSFVQKLIEKITEILSGIFKFLPVGEVK